MQSRRARRAPEQMRSVSARSGDLQNCRHVGWTPEVARDGDYLLTVDEACALFKYSRSGFYRRLRRAGVRLAPHAGHRRFRRSELEPLFVNTVNVVDFAALARAHARGERRRA